MNQYPDKDLPLFNLIILLIDDDIKFHKRFEEAIEPYDHDVICTLYPQEAIKLVQESYEKSNPFDVVFIDYLMPDLNGVETARELKKIDPELILVALTHDGTVETKVMIIKSMAFDLYFLKEGTCDKIEKILACLESTKIEQYSGNESRLSKKIKADQQRALEKKKADNTNIIQE